jgi:hypothetical protein
MLRLIAWFYGRTAPTDPRVWHRWNTLWFVRLVDGSIREPGEYWRRKTPTGWEYRADPPSLDDLDMINW